MVYATVADLNARADQQIVRQLASDDGQTPDDAVIQQALDDAGSIMDGYLASVAVEYRPGARVLVPYAVDIALYRLALRRPGRTFESIKAGYDEAIRFLNRVAEGKLLGGGQGGGDAPATGADAGGNSVMADGPEPLMTRDTLRGL